MPKPQQTDTLLSPAEAAQRLRISVKTLTRYADEGHVPVIVLPSGHRRFRPEDIEALRQPKAAS